MWKRAATIAKIWVTRFMRTVCTDAIKVMS
jgi:hypothetical protein